MINSSILYIYIFLIIVQPWLISATYGIGDLLSSLQCCCTNVDSLSNCILLEDGDCKSDSSYTDDSIDMVVTDTSSGYDACQVIAYGTYPGRIACAVLFSITLIAFVVAYANLQSNF